MKIKIFFSTITGLPLNKICFNCRKFIGLMPINFSRNKLEEIIDHEYLLLEKSDGTRYIFFLEIFQNFLIDRAFSIKKFPFQIFDERTFKNTKKSFLLDGELTFNLVVENFKFLLYDIFCFDGDWRIGSWDLKSRMGSLKFFEKGKSWNSFFFRFLVRKDLFQKITISGLFQKIQFNRFFFDHLYCNFSRPENLICNKNDGIILSPVKFEYLLKSPLPIFKWKFENGNTLDFLEKKKFFQKKEEIGSKYQTELFCKDRTNRLLVFDFNKKLFFTFNNLKRKKAKETNWIGEFFFDRGTNKWFQLKKRKDKKNPNSIRVVINTLENIAGLFFYNELMDKLIKNDIKKQRGKLLNYSY